MKAILLVSLILIGVKEAIASPQTADLYTTWNISAVNQKNDQKILNQVIGIAKPGHLHAIMGPSGCGKTTLLNALANEIALSSLKLTGEIQIPFKSYRVIFIQQEDLLFSQLTVQETLEFARKLTLAQITTKTENSDEGKDQSLLTTLGLQKVMQSKVGDAKTRGLSGGEKKRLSIGQELNGLEVKEEGIKQEEGLEEQGQEDEERPHTFIFVDEPTSGLDCFQAEQVVRLLKSLTTGGGGGGVTVILSIHQPRPSIFTLFDEVTLLSQGRVVYTGPATTWSTSRATTWSNSIAASSANQSNTVSGTARDPDQNPVLSTAYHPTPSLYDLISGRASSTAGLVSYFETLHLPCPRYTNPADHYCDLIALDTTSEAAMDESSSRIQRLQEQFMLSEMGKKVGEKIRETRSYLTAGGKGRQETGQEVTSGQEEMKEVKEEKEKRERLSKSRHPNSKRNRLVRTHHHPLSSLLSHLPSSVSSLAFSLTSCLSRSCRHLSACLTSSYHAVCRDLVHFRYTFPLLWQRSWLQITRNHPLNLARFLSSLFSALLFGVIYYRLPYAVPYLGDRLGLLQVVVINTAMTTLIKATTTFVTEKLIIQREMQRGILYPTDFQIGDSHRKQSKSGRSYGIVPYFLAKVTAELPLLTFFPTFFGTLLYTLCGFHPFHLKKYTTFLTILIAETLATSAFGMFLGSLVSSPEAGIAIAPALMVIFIVFGGSYTTSSHIQQPLLKWIPEISLIRWAYEGLAVNELYGTPLLLDTAGAQLPSATIGAVGKLAGKGLIGKQPRPRGAGWLAKLLTIGAAPSSSSSSASSKASSYVLGDVYLQRAGILSTSPWTAISRLLSITLVSYALTIGMLLYQQHRQQIKQRQHLPGQTAYEDGGEEEDRLIIRTLLPSPPSAQATATTSTIITAASSTSSTLISKVQQSLFAAKMTILASLRAGWMGKGGGEGSGLAVDDPDCPYCHRPLPDANEGEEVEEGEDTDVADEVDTREDAFAESEAVGKEMDQEESMILLLEQQHYNPTAVEQIKVNDDDDEAVQQEKEQPTMSRRSSNHHRISSYWIDRSPASSNSQDQDDDQQEQLSTPSDDTAAGGELAVAEEAGMGEDATILVSDSNKQHRQQIASASYGSSGNSRLAASPTRHWKFF